MAFVHARKSAAFTLIELMVTIAVLGIVVAIAMPSFQRFIADQRVKAAADELVMSFMYARSEAVKRRTTVSVTSLSGGWSAGWQVASGSDVLRTHEFNGLSVSGVEASTVSFGAQGRATLGSSDALNFRICDQDEKATQRDVRLSFSGQARVTIGGACSDAGS